MFQEVIVGVESLRW